MKYHQLRKNMKKLLIIPIQLIHNNTERRIPRIFIKNDLFEMVQSLHYHIYICYRYLALTHEYLMIQHLMGKQIRDPRQRKKLSSSLIEQLYPLILDDRYLSYFPN